jgi:hypothetical protein
VEKQRRLQKLDDINAGIKERSAYLDQVNRDIEAVTLAGNDRLREIAGEIEEAESEKARLMNLNLGLEQKIRENRERLARLSN